MHLRSGDGMQNKSILIVDNDYGVRYTVKNGLEGLDKKITVEPVESGQQCLDFLEDNDLPDLILLDIMMPDMNGWEVAQKIRQNIEWKNIPIVFLTATEDDTSMVTGLQIGVDYIKKPFDLKDLKNRIDDILKQGSSKDRAKKSFE